MLLPMLPFDPGVAPSNVPSSNVPGPREPLYWNGARLAELSPVSVVYDGMALDVTVSSYVDRICFGYVAGGTAVPDPETLIPHTEEGPVGNRVQPTADGRMSRIGGALELARRLGGWTLLRWLNPAPRWLSLSEPRDP